MKIILINMKSILFFVGFFALAAANPSGEILRGRIVGGIEGDYGEFKYQVTIQKISKRAGHMFHLCGGCIISSRHILTAAHCVKDVSGVADATKDLLVVSGTGIIVPGAGTTHKIKSVIINPSYSGKIEDSWKNDIAIITLEKEITFNSLQQLVKLPERDAKPGEIATASGWGVLSYNGINPNYIRKAEMKVVSTPDCQAVIATKIHPGHLCAFSKNGTGLCTGDSGGPLVHEGSVIGVISFVMSPCAQGVPDVFTRVYPYLSWIKSIISRT